MSNTLILKRQFHFALFLLLACNITIHAQVKNNDVLTDQNTEQVNRCATMDRHHYFMQNDAAYRSARHEIDRYAQSYIRNKNNKISAAGGVVVIPVAFHVIYRTATQNISDVQINAQIKQLNDDYRRVNSDRGNTPAPFQGISADMEIQFCLATRDPDGIATTGITRTTTTTTSFTDVTFDNVKPSTVWDRDRKSVV